MKKFRIGIDNYCLNPLKLSPMETLEWAVKNGAEGVQFSGFSGEERKNLDELFLKDLAHFAAAENLYLEWGGGQHIPFDSNTWKRKDIFESNRTSAEQASILGTRIIRSCSGGLMRLQPDAPMTETLLQETASALLLQREMLRDNNVLLAIETHFEFTTFELLRLFELCEAEPRDFLGICLDTMNLLTLLEDPLKATKRILPWIVSTHIKEGGILLAQEGMITFPSGIGKGIVDLRRIAEQISLLPGPINLSIEDHGGSFFLPIFDPVFLSKFPDLTTQEFADLFRMSNQAAKIVQSGKLYITERKDWPDICESRVRQDIPALKAIIKE